MNHFWAHNKFFIITLLAGALLVSAINLIVDPADYFGIFYARNFNEEKTTTYDRGARIVKAASVRRGKYRTIILGSSRTARGLSPKNTQFEPGSAFNLALPGTSMLEINTAFEFARRNLQLDNVILGLDLSLFTTRRTTSGDFEDSEFSGKAQWLLIPKYLFSYKTLSNSYRTVRDNMSGKRAKFRPDGHLAPTVDSNESKYKHRKRFIRITWRYLINQETYAGFRYGKDRIEAVENIMEKCRRDGINLMMFISPVHARQLEVMRIMGLFLEFENWKRDLVRIVEDHNAKHPDEKEFPIWDFSGYNDITTEDIPEVDRKGSRMRWYWESSHYKSKAGDIIISKLLDRGENKNTDYDYFGVILNADNIEAHIADTRMKAERYRETHPKEIDEIELLAIATMRYRDKRKPLDLTIRKLPDSRLPE